MDAWKPPRGDAASQLDAWRWTAALMLLLAALLSGQARALDPGRVFYNYVRDTWTLDQGLPQAAVTSVVQDRDGYLWAGTLNGLARFDGARFEVITPNVTAALPAAQIRALRLDADGRLWVGTQKGLAWGSEGRFTLVPVEAAAESDVDVQEVLVSASGEVFAATMQGLYRVADGRLRRVPAVDGPLFSAIERDGKRWWAGNGGVTMSSGSIEHSFEPLPGLGPQDPVLSLAATGSGASARLWAGTEMGLYLRGAEGWRRFEIPQFGSSPISLVYEDRDQNLWVGGAGGIARIRDAAVVEVIENDRMGARWDLASACEDREGNLWFGSRTRGLMRLWNGLTTRYTTHEGLSTPMVWSVVPDGSGGVWTGTDNGLARLEHGRFREVIAGTALPNPNVHTLMAEPDQLWIGTLRGAAVWRRGQLETIAGLRDLRINAILRDRQRRLWFATSGGLYRLNDAGSTTRIAEADSLGGASIRLLFETRAGRLLLGTQFGLAEFIDGHLHPVGEDQGLPRDLDVTSLYEFDDGRLVVGTATEQLFVHDQKRWIEFGRAQGLPQNSAFFMAEDARGFLWVSGLRGLYRVLGEQLRAPPEQVDLRVDAEVFGADLSQRPTGPHAECCIGVGGAKGFLERGTLWLPTRDGVLAVPTEAPARNPVPPRIRIERLANGLPSADGESLASDQRDLSIRFAVLSFQDPYATRVEFRLRGYDRGWRALPDPLDRRVEYSHLPPGPYVFEIRASNNSGVWSEAPVVLHFRIAPYFYETFWFYCLMALLLGALLFGGLRWQSRLLNRRRAAIESMVAQRTDALAVANQRLEQASYTDPLTGLRNRRYLLNQLPQDLAFYRRKGADSYSPDHVLLFALVDIDHFKRINDGHGHACGDRVLQQFSRRLTELVRVGDYVTRWGGEEFLIVSRPLSRENAGAYADRICRAVADEPFEVGAPHPLRLSCSVGFAEYPLQQTPASLDWQDLIELADRALYYVKDHGRNGWACYRVVDATAYPFLGPRLRAGRETLTADGAIALLAQVGSASTHRLDAGDSRQQRA